MTEPKPLTERELLGLLEWNTKEEILEELRERGLIAPEPEPEPPAEIALKAALEGCNGFQSEYGKVAWSNGFREGFDRGKELRPTLTREMVAEAFKSVFGFHSDYNTDRLHAALMEQMQ